MNLLQRSRRSSRDITTLDDYANILSSMMFNGNTYGLGNPGYTTTYGNGQPSELPPNNLVGYASQMYASNGPVFALMLVRMLVFSAIRFTWQNTSSGKPSRFFGNNDLKILETPWPGGTTQDLLVRMIQDADLAGNSYWTNTGGELVRLRPDYVTILLAPRLNPERFGGGQLGWKKAGYAYAEGGYGNSDPVFFRPDEVMHFAPLPDPLATYRGMSWLTPVLRELQNDRLMQAHKSKFFQNAATPNMVVKAPERMTVDQFKRFIEVMEDAHAGPENAGKTAYIGGGADITLVGRDFQQMDFKTILGHGETRLAAAAGVPPVIAGFSEGLQAATYSNYAQARRRFADGTIHPLWQNAAGSLATLVRTPPGSRLWYDARQVPFLREDSKDAAEILFRKASTMRQLVDAGFKPETVVDAIEAEDYSILKHSGLYSVQLQPPGTHQTNQGAPARPDTTGDANA